MVQHIVMWTFRPEVNKKEAVAHMQEIFAPLPGAIPGMRSIRIFEGYQGYDACLISLHDDADALAVYATHPAHEECKKFVHSVKDQRASCDFLIEE